MADLTVQNLSDEDGAAIAFASAAGGGDKFVHDPRASVFIKNDDVSSTTVTITAVQTVVQDKRFGELTRTDIVLVVAAGAVAVVPPLPEAFRNTADLNKVAITYSSVTSLGVGVGRLS